MFSRISKKQGFTLLEVLLALTIIAVLLGVAMPVLIEQWHGAQELKLRLELQYSMLTAGKTVSDSIRKAKKVEWDEFGILKITNWADEEAKNPDLFYIADKDHDGTKDLYREHLYVANPIASKITKFTCSEVKKGLWQVTLEGVQEKQYGSWRLLVRQRSY